jgi:hypothetical protein
MNKPGKSMVDFFAVGAPKCEASATYLECWLSVTQHNKTDVSGV